MDHHILIKNGLVVDGSLTPPYSADVRVGGGIISEIGPNLTASTNERVVDATGCYVTPGFIEVHNHWDGAVWWSPNMEPYAGYGITTSINGNCGFSLAPIPGDGSGRDDIIEIFNFFEDIPEPPMRTIVPWDWSTWSEYKASFLRNVKVPVNFAAFCGHIPIRLSVMGEDAWTRAATRAEIDRMSALLEDALQAGAMGLSTNHLDYDKHDRPLPPQLADDDEYLALMQVVARHEGATVQLVIDNYMRMTATHVTERLGRIAKQAGAVLQWTGYPMLKFQSASRPGMDALHERNKAEGLKFAPGFTHVEYMFSIDFERTLLFAQYGLQVWQDLVEINDNEEKLETLRDPDWRARARASWDSGFENNNLNPDTLRLRESENGYGPIGVTLTEFMVAAGISHPSDALAEWVVRNGTGSVVLLNGWQSDEEVVVRLLKDPHSVGNISDAGAHGKMFCGAGDNVLLLTRFVRDRKLLSIEEGVHVLTGKAAEFFGLHDRGLLRAGKAADIAVFDLAEVERRDEEKLWDVPDGEGRSTYRYTRAPAPMRLTLVNGVPTFQDGVITGRLPGQFIGPVRQGVQALAAE